MQSENYIYYPEGLTGEELDAFLEVGWYRMGQSIFTTHFILLEGNIHRVFWLRYDLKKMVLSKMQRRVKIRNKQFNISIKPLKITDELEELYSVYKTGINFQPALSVHNWLYGADHSRNVFNTELIEIRDHGKLIAAGIADWGFESMTGIMNFYHPSYKRYSLGKYLMILKIEQAQKRNFRWYYPGYIVYQHAGFDYKLSVDKSAIEVLIPEIEGWRPFKTALIERFGNVISAKESA
jgi:arginyl-tRNA--protein-N-Asp/Glu arginylyltransferase